MDRGFYASEVSRLAGFKSTVMLNYLERVGTFQPENLRIPHHGKNREYTYRDLVILRAINRLLEMGARPKRIAEAISTFKKISQIPDSSDALLEFCRKSSSFVVNKAEVLYAHNPQSLINLTRQGQMELAFVIDISRTLSGVARAARDYSAKRTDNGPKDLALLRRLATKNGI
jgi:DNA-binding transcriptional MerR regulator